MNSDFCLVTFLKMSEKMKFRTRNRQSFYFMLNVLDLEAVYHSANETVLTHHALLHKLLKSTATKYVRGRVLSSKTETAEEESAEEIQGAEKSWFFEVRGDVYLQQKLNIRKTKKSELTHDSLKIYVSPE